MDVLNYNFIRLGLMRAKALQTARRLERETRRRFAVPKLNAFTQAALLRRIDKQRHHLELVDVHQSFVGNF